MAIKDDILQDALKSEVRSKKTSFYSRIKLLDAVDVSSLSNQQKSGNILETNSKQSSIETENKLPTNRQQSDNINQSNLANWKQTGNTTDNKSENKLITNRQQTENESVVKTSFFSLVGLQRAIVLVIYQTCKISRSHTTDPLTLEFIASQVKTDAKSTKTTLQRLEKKGCIIRAGFKNGRGGWTKYKIPDFLYNEMLNLETINKLTTKWQHSENKVVTQLATELTTTNASSSSLNIKTTTTSDAITLSNEWQKIDIEPLVEFGFTQTHLTQIAQQGKLSTEIVQNSIYAFAFDLKHNNKGKTLKTDAVNFFMGILRNGKPYAPPSNYYSPQEEAMQRYIKKQRELEQKKLELEKTILELAFNEWLATLSVNDKNQIIPSVIRELKSETQNLGALKDHFTKEVWPTKRAEIVQPMS
jgi:hypothetical protein